MGLLTGSTTKVVALSISFLAPAFLPTPAYPQPQTQQADSVKYAIIASDGRKYSITNSRITVATEQSPPTALYWLSDEDVMFISMTPRDRAQASDASKFDYQVAVWNISKDTVRLIQDFGPNRPRICANDGYLLFSTRSAGQGARVLHGQLNALREDDSKKAYSYVFCRPVDQLPVSPPWANGRSIVWLQKMGEGFVDFGDRQKIFENTPVHLYRNGAHQDQGIELPLRRRDISNKFPYFSFSDAFFVDSWFSYHPPPKDVPYPVYWLYRSGRVEKILEIPWGPWRSAASFWPLPTKAGIAFVSHNANVRDVNDLAHAGMYFFDRRNSSRLLKAWIATASASPGGCKVAFTHANAPTRKANVLQVIDVCRER